MSQFGRLVFVVVQTLVGCFLLVRARAVMEIFAVCAYVQIWYTFERSNKD